jgi:Outer membrane protein beta-barrel domain
MQENEFEDQVQKIMNELSFDPQDAVWAGVAKEIEKDKKRRKPLFWIFLIGVPVIIGAGYFVGTGNLSGSKSALNLPARVDSIHSNISAGKTSRITDSADVPAEQSALVMNQPVTGQAGAGGSNRTGIKNRKAREKDHTSNKPDENSRKEKGKTTAGVIPETLLSEDNGGSEKLNAENAAKTAATTGVVSERKNLSADSAAVANVPVPVSTKSPDSSVDSKKTDAKKKNKSAWTFGLTGNLGASGINQPFGNQSYALYGPSNSSGGGGSVTYAVQPPNPTAAFSFSAGAFVQRSLSGRISISGGLNYHYFSAKTTIGNLVSNSGSTYNANLTYSSRAYYTNTGSHSYTNQFHFIELPVLVDFTLNKNKQTPLIWEAGFSFAYLLSSDYLYFDPYANVYYKNDGVLNKDQWDLSTALLIGWNMQKSRFLMGPQLQYGINGLLNASQAYSQYLYSFGLKISFIPGGK